MSSLLSRIINTLAPSNCAICGDRLTVGEHFICSRCIFRLPRTYFELSPLDNEMAKMFWGRFHVEKCMAMFYYHSHSASSGLILKMKYNRHPDYGYELGRMIAREILPSGFFDGITCVMPLPLARNRERQRGYNQSREIARGICAETALTMIDKAIKRKPFIDTQTHKTRAERNDNVENAFSLVNAGILSGNHILLIDDVATTGATVSACAREMEKAGNVKISVLTAGFVKH